MRFDTLISSLDSIKVFVFQSFWEAESVLPPKPQFRLLQILPLIPEVIGKSADRLHDWLRISNRFYIQCVLFQWFWH